MRGEADFDAVFLQDDSASLAEAAPELNAILASLPEPTETESFEVPQSLIDTLAVG